MSVNQGENKMTNEEMVLEFIEIRKEIQTLYTEINYVKHGIDAIRDKLGIEFKDLRNQIDALKSSFEYHMDDVREDTNYKNAIQEIRDELFRDMRDQIDDVKEDTNYRNDIEEIREELCEMSSRMADIEDELDETHTEDCHNKSDKDRLPWDEKNDVTYLRDDLLKRVELDVYHYEKGDEDLTIRDILMEWAYSLQEAEEQEAEENQDEYSEGCDDCGELEDLKDTIRHSETSLVNAQKTLRQIRNLWNLSKNGSHTQSIQADVDLGILIDNLILPEVPITHNRRKYDCR
jgi:hypothetical protein